MDAVNVTPGHGGTAVKHPGILYPLMLAAAAAVIVFSIAGIATMMGWMPGAPSSSTDGVRARTDAVSGRVPRNAAGATACRDCGVVESLRAVEDSVKYEIRVRMSDGALRTLYQSTRPALTVGQKVRVTHQGVITG